MTPSAMPDLPGGLSAPVEATVLSGGQIGQVWRVRLADGDTVVVKATGYDARLEAEGLDALRAAGGPVPRVVAADAEVLVLEHVTGPGDLHRLGAGVATIHRAVGESFGWSRDNVIGPLPQPNTPDDDWPTFHAERRLGTFLDLLPPELERRLRTAIEDGRLAGLLDHEPPPSLVHGDLWWGNVVADRWLIDPAVHRADREVDLAMLDLFGSVPATFERGYTEVWPLPDGWQRRRPALQLWPLLVHVRLFGAGYLGGVASRLDQLGW